ncbi:MutL C terminal dimerization domain-containing protein [Chloropicon primus]|nr:MutL C terminal dimerization domain-containing protein [Chloropicon primus]
MIPKAGACECCAGGGREAVRLRVDAAFRAGRTGIGVGDIKSLSYLETSIVPASITRGMLDRALCLGQVDNKFVASVCGSTLVLFDQHAADERVRLERFTEILTEDLGSRDRDSSSSPASVNVYGFGGSEASLHGAGNAKGRSEDIATAFANGIVSGINTLDRSSSHAVYGAGGNAKSEGGGQSSAHAENWKGAVSGTSGSVSKSASDSHDHYHAYKPYVHAMADGHYGAEGYGPMVASQGGQHSDSEASGAQAGSSNVAGTRSYQGPSPEALRRVSMGVQHATSEGLGFLTWLKP